VADSISVSQEKQLVVEGDNGLNYTPLASYSSSDPTKLTVTNNGKVKGIAVGSATVNISYLPAGAAEALEASVEFSVTV